MQRRFNIKMSFLICLVMLATVSAGHADELVFESRFVWHNDAEGFGGFSGIEVSDDGKNFVAISDRGRIATGHFQRENNQIAGISQFTFNRLRGVNGDLLNNRNVDSEGLAQALNGDLFISFEAFHRVRKYAFAKQKAASLPDFSGFDELQNNSGMEALAIDARGVLYSIPERSGAWEKPFPVFRYHQGQWDASLTIPRRDKFLPVGADFGPDGRFYLLERDFTWYLGFSNRIRVFTLGPDGFDSEQTLLTTERGAYGNLEGLSVWQDATGQLRLTMIGDDNFSMLLETEIVEYRLVEG